MKSRVNESIVWQGPAFWESAEWGFGCPAASGLFFRTKKGAFVVHC